MTNGRVLTSTFSIVQAIWGNSYPFLARPINLNRGENVSRLGHLIQIYLGKIEGILIHGSPNSGLQKAST